MTPQSLLDASHTRPQVVLFTRPHCTFSAAMARLLKSLAEHLRFPLSITEDASVFGLTVYAPTFIVLRGGRITCQHTGLMTESGTRRVLDMEFVTQRQLDLQEPSP